MKNYKKISLIKVLIIFLLLSLTVTIFGVTTLLSKRSHAETGSLTYSGERYSSDLGYNVQAAENFYRFSVGTSIKADNLKSSNGTYISTSNKVTITLAMQRKDTGLNKGYAIFTAMFFRVEKYDYNNNSWSANAWESWFSASVHKSGSSSHYFDGWDVLNEMRSRGQYPEGSVYSASGADKIDLRDVWGTQILCKDLFDSAPSLKGRLTSWANTDNTSYSFDLYRDGRYRIAITSIGWRWEMGEDAGRKWVVDGNRRITSNEFIIDNSAPTGTIKKVNGTEVSINGGYINENVYFDWTKDGSAATAAKLNGNPYNARTVIYAEGKHTIVLKDVELSTTYSFIIDKSPPNGRLTGVDNNGYTNKDVIFEWDKPSETEAPISASICHNDEPKVAYISGTKITEEGDYNIMLSDAAGNWREYSFTIDKTAPVGTLYGVTNGGYTNQDVNFRWDEPRVSATLNGSSYIFGREITVEGFYTIVLTDRAGNSSTYTFTIDKTAPTGELSTTQSGGFRTGNYTNGNVRFEWSDKEATATLNGANYISGDRITAENSYTIELKDLANNITIYKFIIDTTAPMGTLNGVNSNGYSNSSVTFTWTESSDTVKALLNGVGYPKGQIVQNEGVYEIILTDAADNRTVYTFVIDKTAPTGTLYGVINGGYTNSNVRFEWSDTQASATINGKGYINGDVITAEAEYEVVITDFAKNSTTYRFVIDKTAPIIEMGVFDGEHTCNDVYVILSDRYEVSGLYGLTDSGYVVADIAFQSGRKFEVEGNYTIKAVDAAGNVTEKHFTLDKSAPVIDSYSNYTNVKLTLTAQDKYGTVGAWEYRFNDGDKVRVDEQTLTIAGGSESNGVWQVRVIDELGNTSKWNTINFVYRQTFGNSDKIYNSFSVPSYFTVTLSQKNYPECFGSFTFAEYDSAFKFAVSKEWECRVIVLDGGRSWNYVNISNENTRQIYTDRKELDAVIEKYARKNIGDRKVLGQNGSHLNNPTDSDGVTRDDALTVQINDLPELLSDYNTYRFMLSLASYSFISPQSIVDGNRATATIQFLSDGISLRIGREITIEYGANFAQILEEEGEQGWYLITERDVCGNVEKYLIFIDFEQPELYANVTYGNQSKELINFNQAFIDANAETMRYTEFDISSLSDNIDEFVMLFIEGRNANIRYVWGDEIPVLNYENGYYGAYKIIAYDRSCNVLEFTIYIAGAAPTLRHSSVTNDTSCTFTIQINDSYNEITDVKFYKVYFDGTYDRLYADSYNTPVNAENLIYKVNIGGKYVFEFTDLYGRTVRTDPIFYMKGLPSATFRGVKDGGLTKNDVGITYDKDVALELFILSDSGEWFVFERYEVTQGVSTNTANITAGRETTGIYKVLLYKTEDRNLFTEYTFEIDGIPPEVQILSENGNGILPETVTTQSFYVTWQESGYRAYYKRQGALSESQYSKQTVITKQGTYIFTIYDTAKNELSFAVTLDNSVSYTLDGTYTLLEDGSYITRKSFTLTITEPYAIFNVVASNGINVVNGQKLDTDGTYAITVSDLYGNSMSLTLIVDKLPPVPVIQTESGENLSNGARTQNSFRVFCEESNVTITYSEGNNQLIAYDGALIENVGTYNFRVTDRVGNVADVSVTIDREVSYGIEGNYTLFDGVYHSRSYILIVAQEEYFEFKIMTYDGSLMDNTKKISEEGSYTVTITDIAGNSIVLKLAIDKTAPEVQILSENGTALDGKEIINEAFKLFCAEKDAVLTYSFNDSKSIAYNGELFYEPGIYTYTVTDRIGNSANGTITIDKEVKYLIDGRYQIFDDRYCSNSWVQIIPKEDMSLFTIETENGNFIDTEKRITSEGIYNVILIDVAGNTIVLIVEIDKTAPNYKVITESGNELNSGAVNEPFRVVCDEDGAMVEFSTNNGGYANYDGAFITIEGVYSFRITDRLGNYVETSVLINFNITYGVEGAQEFKNGIYYSSGWLYLTPQKDIANFVIYDVNGKQYDTSKRLTEEGEYTAEITDTAGNKVEIKLVIDKTAPKLLVQTESGLELESGATTNESFRLVCTEQNAKLSFSYLKSDFKEYTGEWFSEQGKYTVTAVDFLGNKIELIINIDTEVKLTFSGTYVIDEEGRFISKSWLLATPGEELKVFYVLSSDGSEVDVGSKLSVEDEYLLFAEDLYGNKLEVKLVIDKTPPVIILEGASDGGATNAAVAVNCEGYSELLYSLNGGNKLTLAENTIFEAEGRYTVTARDIVGNTATAVFSIDKHVDVVPSVSLPNGCIITGAVSFKFNETVSAVLSYNGEELIYERGEITKQGNYVLTVTDDCGNIKKYDFIILPSKAQSYSIPVANTLRIVAEQNGQPMQVQTEEGTLKLTESGEYVLRFYSDNSSWTLRLEVDNIAPEVFLENTGKTVKISSPNKDGITYTLYRNGEKISFKMTDSADITQKGEYRLVCEDDVGNVTEYLFTINYLSGVAIALIVVICVLVVAAILTVIILRVRCRIS